jgi:hypothetical protein
MIPKKFSRVFSNDSLSPQIILTNLFEEITGLEGANLHMTER